MNFSWAFRRFTKHSANFPLTTARDFQSIMIDISKSMKYNKPEDSRKITLRWWVYIFKFLRPLCLRQKGNCLNYTEV